jgi:hypothetical protein
VEAALGADDTAFEDATFICAGIEDEATLTTEVVLTTEVIVEETTLLDTIIDDAFELVELETATELDVGVLYLISQFLHVACPLQL